MKLLANWPRIALSASVATLASLASLASVAATGKHWPLLTRSKKPPMMIIGGLGLIGVYFGCCSRSALRRG